MAKYKFVREISEVEMTGGSDRCAGIRLKNAFEKAVYNFLENHLMDKMVRECCNRSNQLFPREKGFDIKSGSACMEIKVFMPSVEKRHGCMRAKLHQCIKQRMEHGNRFSTLLGEKRKILLVAGQEGICEEIRELANRESVMSLIGAADTGLELWIAEIKFEPTDGITLLSCRNIDHVLPNGHYLWEGGEKFDG